MRSELQVHGMCHLKYVCCGSIHVQRWLHPSPTRHTPIGCHCRWCRAVGTAMEMLRWKRSVELPRARKPGGLRHYHCQAAVALAHSRQHSLLASQQLPMLPLPSPPPWPLLVVLPRLPWFPPALALQHLPPRVCRPNHSHHWFRPFRRAQPLIAAFVRLGSAIIHLLPVPQRVQSCRHTQVRVPSCHGLPTATARVPNPPETKV